MAATSQPEEVLPSSEERRRLRALIDHIPAMVAYWDRDQINVLANAAYVKWFGKTPEEMRGMHIRNLLGEPLYRLNLKYILGALEGEQQRFSRTLVDADGEVRYTEATYVPDIGPDNQVRGFFAQVADVTELTIAHRELDGALAFRDAVLSATPDVISIYDLETSKTIWASRAMSEALGYDIGKLQELQSRGLDTLLDPESTARFQAAMQEVGAIADGDFVEDVTRVRAQDGSWRVFARRSTPFKRTADGRVLQVLNAARDVTAESEQAAALKRLNAFQQAVIATAPDLIIVVHVATGRVTWTSRPLSSLLGWSDADIAELGDRPLEAIAHWDDVGELRQAFDAASAAGDGELTHVRYRTRTAHKPWRWLSLSMTAFEHAANGAVTSVLATARDVTELVESEGQLAHAALHDPLTGLPNRRLIADRLDTAVAGLARGGAVGVLFIDLDGFKRINDGFGHAAGDAVLRETADRLCLAVRPADTVGRVGGDEFVVVAPSLPAAHAHPIAAQLAERIRRDLAVPIVWEAQQHQVTASVGIVLAEPGSDAQSLLRDADSAMYVAKRRGKDTIAEFDPILREQAIRRSSIEQAIRRALATSSVEVFYQPIVRLTDKAITSVEALLRIRDEAGNYLDTSQVIEVAEATGLITDIGPEVMRIATQQLQTTPGIPRVAVNLSAREIARTDFYARVRGNLDAVGLPPDRLALELTETVLLEAPHATLRDLERLREDGIAIAIDDFGTGFASLRYLTTLPVTAIKIDRSFTSGLGYDHINESIVAACLWLTNELDIECIVEGIETSLQLEHLAPGAHVYAQGYYLGAPAPSGQPPTEE